MRYRTATIQALKSLGTSGTTLFDIDITDPISALFLYCELTLSTGARLAPNPEAFTKIELIDGSDVLLNLSGTEMDALHFFERGKVCMDYCDNRISTTAFPNLMLLFGRKLWDTELAFVPTKFRNPQLRITHDCAKVQANATPLKVEILAECFDERAVSPSGFLMNREFKSFTPVTGTYEYTDLDTDKIIRKLIVQVKKPGSGIGLSLAELRLSEDNDKKIPFDILMDDLVTLNAFQFGEVSQYVGGYSDVDLPYWGAPGYSGRAAIVLQNTAEVFVVNPYDCGKLGVSSSTTTNITEGIWKGLAPYQCLVYPFGEQMDMADWYDASRLGNLKLRLKGGSAVPSGALTNIILQQLRKY
jgi:hypothetical protein